MVNLTELTAEKEINIGLFEKVVHRVVLQNPNLRYLMIFNSFWVRSKVGGQKEQKISARNTRSIK